MKANELRIGNLFQDKDGNVLTCFGVAPHDDTNQFHVWYGNELGFYLEEDEVFAIKLTEDIMNNCVYITIGDIDMTEYYVLYDEVDEFWKLYRSHDKAFITFVETVHELQNVYFVLSDDELEFLDL